ncbi:MAG TPA: DNA translocase FtsK [Xanthobacteraceae bacterium]|jgi:S-DNA-T family DNA segregation ATPase FtsK/SpoIIIE|nr:DNA translocase FtsK [Xanthobacteraceae bacterium]
MSSAERSHYGGSFLSDDFHAAIRRRLRELGALVLFAAVGIVAAALATWSVNDPSLSYATSAPVRNLLGATGAIAADLAMQLFGVATIAIILPPAFWGWRFFTHRILDRLRWRIAAWIGGLILSAAFASCLTRTPRWPLPTGIGGVAGDALLRVIASIAGGPLHGAGQTFAETIFGTLAFVTVAIASGFGFHQPDRDTETEDDEEGARDAGSISIGWLVHAFLSLKARVIRSIVQLFGAVAIFRRQVSTEWLRSEPRLGARSGEAEEPHEPWHEADDDETQDAKAMQARKSNRKAARADRKSAGGYELPSLSLLAAPKASERAAPSMEAIRENATALEHVLSDFGVRGEIINARPGPVVTLYELEPAPGIKSSRVIGLADDIARSMSALSARVAVVSGRNVIGIELPNQTREKVYLRELLADDDYAGSGAKLALCLGKTIGGESVIVDLARMPHLLIAGTTGSGKSVAINTMILSLLYRLRPEQCRLIMVDPKMLELSVYDGIPHLLAPVVTDPKKAVVALKWAVREMEDRYKKMAKLGVRNIDGYNARLSEARARGEVLSRTVHTGYDPESGDAIYEKEEFDQEPLPYLVVIVDEMADLMMVAGKDIEGAIQRLAQMARAAGIHVILATQRPSVDVITGTIKANFPTRISFQVTSKIDSRTILGEQGAEQLLGQGDMLYMVGGGRISRIHGPFVSDDEVEKIVRHLKSQGQPLYLDAVTAEDDFDVEGNAVFDATGMGGAEGADLYQQAVQIVTRDRKASTSYIQRRLQIGYNRAASLIERMEQEGVVGQPNHAGKREILVGGEDNEDY